MEILGVKRLILAIGSFGKMTLSRDHSSQGVTLNDEKQILDDFMCEVLPVS